MAKLKIVVFPILINSWGSSLTDWAGLCDSIRDLAGFPEDAEFIRQTRPWNQNILVYWYYHPSFEDIPDYDVYEAIFLKREQIEEIINK